MRTWTRSIRMTPSARVRPSTGATANGFAVTAVGDVNGNGTTSTFGRGADVRNGSVVVATQLYIDKEDELQPARLRSTQHSAGFLIWDPAVFLSGLLEEFRPESLAHG